MQDVAISYQVLRFSFNQYDYMDEKAGKWAHPSPSRLERMTERRHTSGLQVQWGNGDWYRLWYCCLWQHVLFVSPDRRLCCTEQRDVWTAGRGWTTEIDVRRWPCPQQSVTPQIIITPLSGRHGPPAVTLHEEFLILLRFCFCSQLRKTWHVWKFEDIIRSS